MDRDKETFILWDAEGPPPCTDGMVYLWSGNRANAQSLLRYVEDNAQRLRAKYLAFIHDLGQRKIAGVRLVEHMALNRDYSFWWSSLIVERSPWNSTNLLNATRLLALEEILGAKLPGRVFLASANEDLHESLSALCAGLNIPYTWHDTARNRTRIIRARLRLLRTIAHAFVTFARLALTSWPFRRQKALWPSTTKDTVFFCSYFFNLIPLADVARAKAHSDYWKGLSNLFATAGVKPLWLQLFRRSEEVPDASRALRWADDLQQKGEGHHVFLESFMSWEVLINALLSWLRLIVRVGGMSGLRDAFHSSSGHVSLWPVMRNDWWNSVIGPHAVENLIAIELFDQALRELPLQEKGFYLYENQSWERAFITAWRKHGHGELFAVQHATVRFWDLRYFSDPRALADSSSFSIPLPHGVVLNGDGAVSEFRAAGFPDNMVIRAEALRYGYLADLSRRTKTPGRRRLLIFGDFERSVTMSMLKMLESAVQSAGLKLELTFRPHPHFRLDTGLFPRLHLMTSPKPLSELLEEHDIAYCSTLTSASIDAWLSGLPVAIAADPNGLNLSPLRSRPGVHFVANASELAKVLSQAPVEHSSQRTEAAKYFYLSESLPLWEALMSRKSSSKAVAKE